MKKKVVSLILTLTLLLGLTAAAAAYTQQQYRIAEALNELGLFLGTEKGYELDTLLGRDDGTTLLVRMLGKEKAAQEGGDFGMPFTDVPFWAKGYVGYAWKHSITNGVSATEFGADQDMTDNMFLTLVLRALGYSDGGEEPLFTWRDPYGLAVEVGLLTDGEPDKDFTRGEAIEIFWRALDVKCFGEDYTLADRLMDQGVFTVGELAYARDIQKNGRPDVTLPEQDETETPVVPPVTPDTPEEDPNPGTSTEPENPEPDPDPSETPNVPDDGGDSGEAEEPGEDDGVDEGIGGENDYPII